MKKKLVSILMASILLAVIPVVSGVTVNSEPATPEPTGLFDKTTIRGIVLFPHIAAGGKSISFFALRLHYRTQSLNGEHFSGVVFLQPIKIPNDFNGYMGKFYIALSFSGDLNI